MTDRVVRVVLQAIVADYQKSMAGAAKSAEGLGKTVKATSEQTHKSFDTLGKGMLVGGAVVAAGLGMAVRAAMNFNAEMSLVKTLSHATPAEMAKLRDAALNMGQALGFSAMQTASAEEELVKAGISVADIMGGALKGALVLAAAGQIDVGKATEIATIAMTQFGLAGKDIPHVADLLSAGADKALGGVSDLGEALKSGGLVANQFGVSIEQTIGTLSAFANAGLLGEAAGTDMRQMLLKLARPSKEAADTLDQLGIAVYGADGKFVGFSALAGELQDKLGKLAPAQRNAAMATIFGARAIVGANILYQQGAQGITDWTNKVNDSGFAMGQATGKMDNLKGDLSKLGAAFQKDLIDSGTKADGALRFMTQSTTDLVKAYGDLPGPVQATVVALGGVVAVTTLVGGAVMLGVGKVAKFRTAMDTLGVSSARTERSVRLMGLALKGLGVAGTVIGLAALNDSIAQMGVHDRNMGQLAESIANFATQGLVSGELLKIAGKDFDHFGDTLKTAQTHWLSLGNVFGSETSLVKIKQAQSDIDALDKTLAGMVTSGHGDAAAKMYQALASAAAAQGVPQEKLNALFDDYRSALGSTAADSKLAGGATDTLTQKLQDQEKAATDAAKAIRDEASAVKALFDPIFGVIDATQKQKQAQLDLNAALKAHGSRSKEYRDAEEAALRATVDLDGAVLEMKASLADGSSSLSLVNARLDSFVRAGLISAAQARHYKDELAGAVTQSNLLAGALDNLNGKHPAPTVKVQDAQAMAHITALQHKLDALDGHSVTTFIDVRTRAPVTKGLRTVADNKAIGGYVTGPGSSTSDSIPTNLSNGEYVINAAATAKHRALLDLINNGRMVPASNFPGSVGHAAAASAGQSAVAGGDTYHLTVNNPVPEPVSNLPRTLSKMTYLMSAA